MVVYERLSRHRRLRSLFEIDWLKVDSPYIWFTIYNDPMNSDIIKLFHSLWKFHRCLNRSRMAPIIYFCEINHIKYIQCEAYVNSFLQLPTEVLTPSIFNNIWQNDDKYESPELIQALLSLSQRRFILGTALPQSRLRLCSYSTLVLKWQIRIGLSLEQINEGNCKYKVCTKRSRNQWWKSD